MIPEFIPTGFAAGNPPAGDLGTTINAESPSELPVPIGGVITLEANKTYVAHGLIDLGTDVLVTSGPCAIRGHSSETCGFQTSNASAALLTSTHTIDMSNLRLINTATGGRCIDLTGPDGGQTRLEYCVFINGAQDLYTGSAGSVPPVLQVRDCQWSGGVGGIRITGSITAAQFVNVVFFGVTGPSERIMEMDSSLVFTTSAEVVGCFYQTVAAGQTGLHIDPAVVIPLGGLILSTGFSGPGTRLGGIDSTTPGWNVSGNPVLRDSDYAAQMAFTGNSSLTNCSVDGQWFDIVTGVAYTLEADSERFSLDVDELVYGGKREILARLIPVSTLEPDTGSNLTFETRVVRDRSAVVTQVAGPFRFDFKTETVTSAGTGLVLLQEGDRLRQQVRRVGSTGNVRVVNSSLLSS